MQAQAAKTEPQPECLAKTETLAPI